MPPLRGLLGAFNEGWGQFDAAGAVEAVRRLDDTRLVDEASGWYDQAGEMWIPCTTISIRSGSGPGAGWWP